MLSQRARSVSAPALIIPIIMAHYENVINNTEDIVVAISHMVVGLCSVTISPLASTYVCQERASMTSASSAHLALPEVKVTGEMLISSGEFFMHILVGLGTNVRYCLGRNRQNALFRHGASCTPAELLLFSPQCNAGSYKCIDMELGGNIFCRDILIFWPARVLRTVVGTHQPALSWRNDCEERKQKQ